MLPNLRVVENIDEVVSALAACEVDKYRLLLWQNIDNKRIQSFCEIHSFSHHTELLIELDLVDDKSSFDHSKEFFLYQEDLNFLFKGRLTVASKSRLILKMEDKLFLKENRTVSRFTFENVSFDVTLDYIDQTTQKKKTLKAELVDISESGFSFLIPASRSINFYEGMQISLRCLETIKFSKPILGSIRYNKASKVKFSITDIKYGVSFKEKSSAIAIAMKLFKEKSN